MKRVSASGPSRGSSEQFHPLVFSIARAVRDAGGRAFLVGGVVRDLVARRLSGASQGAAANEIDFEVYGLPVDRLVPCLSRFGPVKLVGESFAVYKVMAPPMGAGPGAAPAPEIDVSLPRRDLKVGPGHRGFRVEGDPHLSYEEATRRRDFTINAMMHDPLTGETIDLWQGEEDLSARRLRAVDPETFVEDSLRVLRGVQFAARFDLTIDPGTVALCRRIDLADLPAERIWGEMEKLLMRAARPSLGLTWADRLGVIEKLFPELQALQGCPQEKEWHPEGDVWVHTLMAIDQAKKEIDGLEPRRRITVLLAVLCHDFGKPATTAMVDGRIRSYEHEAAGVAPTEHFLDRLRIRTLDGYDVRSQVLALVAHHLTPSHYFKNRANVGDGAFRRLAAKLEPELLYRVSRSDCLGRTGEFSTEAQEWFIDRVRHLGVEQRPPKPILLGRHLLEMGLRPGPRIGRVTRAVYEMQLDGRIADLEAARREARRILESEPEEGAAGPSSDTIRT